MMEKYKYGNRLRCQWIKVIYCNGLDLWNYAILNLDTLPSLLISKSKKNYV